MIKEFIQIGRQNHLKGRSLADNAGHIDLPLMVIDDLVTDRQSQTGPDADAFGSETGIEDMGQILFGYARTVVSELDFNFIILTTCRNGYSARTLHSLNRINQDIEENLVQLPGKTGHRGDIAVILTDCDAVLDFMVD